MSKTNDWFIDKRTSSMDATKDAKSDDVVDSPEAQLVQMGRDLQKQVDEYAFTMSRLSAELAKIGEGLDKFNQAMKTNNAVLHDIIRELQK